MLFRSAKSKRPEMGLTAPVGRARRLRDAETDQLVRRYLEVRNMRQVAREFRMSRTTVAKLLSERGIETSRSMKPSEVKQAMRMYKEGLSSITIGKQLGFDNHTVLKVLRSEGVSIRMSASGRQTGARLDAALTALSEFPQSCSSIFPRSRG
ncbi:uncharacterized protein MalAC0309_0655 [Microcella alkaliphila]|uniref:Uncharacterized protein n=1 Tax=Microcella alkaliphila TaxID=279828 RepID=A0A0U5B6N9_9MICO|nr:uncharacterized protein MalAC0309_0655 [Microcella alkaliphila]